MLNKDIHFFSEKLQIWYSIHKRNLPWRNTTDAYTIWLSEIILQQTRVAQGLPYFVKFVENYPTVISMANATQEDVLRLWQGLGYYSRARNMHSTVQYIVQNNNAIFPKTYAELIKLKGIGSYTASAIASFANDETVAVVDGNVFRVLSRIFGIDNDISSPKGKKIFLDLAFNLLPKQTVSIHNQAIMEFGALNCMPKNPQCENCTFNINCFAFKNNLQGDLPVNLKKLKITNRYFSYFVIELDGQFFMNKRQEKDIWQGLFQFYLAESRDSIATEALFEKISISNFLNGSTVLSVSEVYNHQLTHQKLAINFIHIQLKDPQNSFYQNNISNFYSIAEIDQLPKPIVLANYFNKFLEN